MKTKLLKSIRRNFIIEYVPRVNSKNEIYYDYWVFHKRQPFYIIKRKNIFGWYLFSSEATLEAAKNKILEYLQLNYTFIKETKTYKVWP